MEKFGVTLGLEHVALARREWTQALRKFEADVEYVMKRLINEAAVNYMSAEQVAAASGLTVKRVRLLMRNNGLDPKRSKRLLAKRAAETLAENAALLGVEPHEVDLMSPLAYLPAGSVLRRQFLETQSQGVTVDERRDLVAAAIYGDGGHGDWLTTEDGSPNAESYALADRVLAVLNPEGENA